MKIMEFDSFYCVMKEKKEVSAMEQVKKVSEDSDKKGNPPKMKENYEEFVLSRDIFKRANLRGDIELEVMDCALVATSKEMTVLGVLSAINSLETKLNDLYSCLIENFLEDWCCSCDSDDEMDSDDGIFTVEWLNLIQELENEFDLDFFDGRKNISDVPGEMLEKLSDIGLSLEEMNYSIMEEEVIYFGTNASERES